MLTIDRAGAPPGDVQPDAVAGCIMAGTMRKTTGRGWKMQTAVCLLFLLTGVLFLLISTVWYPAVVQFLNAIQARTADAPDFWNLSLVLGFVRVIFLLVGVFLAGFSVVLFRLRKHWPL